MKKLISLLMTLVLCVSFLSGCVFGGNDNKGNTTTPEVTQGATTDGSSNEGTTAPTDAAAVDESGLPPMTTEEITLTYMNFDSDVLTQELAKKFMEKYPNIKVESTYVVVGDYETTLTNLIAAGTMPDAFMFGNADYALSNKLLYDMTDLWNADPENQNIMPTINELAVGTYDSGRQWAAPIKYFPSAIYIDRTLMETLNQPMPATNWTWAEMIQLVKDTTDKTASPAYYGIGGNIRLDSLYGIAASQTIKGEFGWDGTGFDLGIWAVGEQEQADLKLNGYVAPNVDTIDMQNWLGDSTAWAGSSGRVALMAESYWTYMNLWNTDEYKTDLNINYVPYPVPSVEKVDGVANAVATLDMGGISASTEHPREAYELLKFMGWGADGWKAKLEIYQNESITNAAGAPLIRDAMPVPLTLDEEVWAGYRALYPTDEVDGPYWDNYFAAITRPVPYGWMSIAGYWNFCVDYFNSINIHQQVDTGKAKAADYADEATAQANEFHKQAMKEYFNIDWEPTN